jgi:hypothetical protein
VNIFDPALFSMTASCLPCCAEPVAECECEMPLPYGDFITAFGDVFSNYATAEAVIGAFTADCYLAWSPLGFTLSDLTASCDTSTPNQVVDLVTGVENTVNGKTLFLYNCIACAAGTLVVDWDIAIANSDALTIDITIRDCAGNVVDNYYSDTDPSGSTNITIPAAGIYFVEITSSSSVTVDGSSFSTEITVSNASGLVANPVVALWNDSGTTRKLWACPKLYLPPLTESTGNWYADCAAAATVLTDPLQVSNCVGFLDDISVVPGSFTATDGGTSLTLAQSSLPSPPASNMWGSVNLEAGETLTISISGNGGALDSSTADIYDYTGTLVESIAAGSETLVSSALPYTGRYTVMVRITLTPPGSPPTSVSAVLTSSGVLSVNEIQALYDVGLDCPARLNCGDSCP